MAKYQADVQTLLRAIGGRENIQAVSHCMTRMRFVLAAVYLDGGIGSAR